MREILNKPWDYQFFEDGSKYYLFVVCGGVGVYEINIELSEEECTLYKTKGNKYIEELARKIQLSPSSYSSRNLPENDKA